MSTPKGLIIDGVAASSAIDSSGEILLIEGVDISDWQGENPTGLVNWEHRSDTDVGHSALDIVGKIIYAKKIYDKSDCENDRQEMYWDKVGLPFIYIICRLYDAAGHPAAIALAATMRDHLVNNEKILCRFSIEGSTLEKDGNVIKASVARRVALTVKPCNRQCDTGILEDPNAPEGFDKFPAGRKEAKDILESVDKHELQDPMYLKMGAVEYDCNPLIPAHLHKALTAGGGNCAPSVLTGGAALAREEFCTKKMTTAKAEILSAIRDYGAKKEFNKAEFKNFLKAQMPTASDDFLDHFTNLVDDYRVKVKKAAEEIVNLQKKAEEEVAPKAPAKAPKTEVKAKKPPVFKATIRGVPVKPNKKLKAPMFDEDKGVLHTEFGSFPLHNPEFEHFNTLLSNPKAEEVHNKAMDSWVKVHKLMKEGKTPPEVISHAALFSINSPNTPVPMQELMYGHLVDKMKETGADPIEPGFKEKVAEPWYQADNPKELPKIAREFFAGNKGIRLKNVSAASGRQPGDIGGFMLGPSKMENMDKYHKLHKDLVALVAKHGKNARAAITELMEHKRLGTNWEGKRQQGIAKGKPDIGEYPGPRVQGLAPKTARYAYSMMGGGNAHVPDTHFVRHLTGLEMGKDNATIEKMKNLFWNEGNSHVLEGIDRWYAKNHPAVKHMMQHPIWGKHFDTAEDAVFPAFWKHWIAIAEDERSRGMKNQAQNEGTTHAPFWESIDPYINPEAIKKSEDNQLPLKTAEVHQQYINDYGEVPASMLYFANLVPHLLDSAERREKEEDGINLLIKTRQAESIGVDLKKAVEDFERHPTLMDKEVSIPEVSRVHIKIGDNHHPAGRFMIYNGQLKHLEDNHGIINKFLPEGPVTAQTVSRIHGLKMSPHLAIEHDGHEHLLDDDVMSTPEVKTPEPTVKASTPSVFDYKRAGHDRAHTLEVSNGTHLLDGNPLNHYEIDAIVQNIRNGTATVNYKQPSVADRIQKMEKVFTALMKAEEEVADPDEALQAVRAAVKAGHIHPSVERALTKHIYSDPMTGVGNKYAYGKFLEQKKPGVHIMMDGNDFSKVNNAFGHEAGDQAIKSFGKVAREAMQETMGDEKAGKLFRAGGDEFSAIVPSHEHASKFSRILSKKLDSLPPIGGVHKLSMSMGIGHDPTTADKALYKAKEEKNVPGTVTRKYAIGQVPTLVHSLFPGHEGPVPVHNPVMESVSHVLSTVKPGKENVPKPEA